MVERGTGLLLVVEHAQVPIEVLLLERVELVAQKGERVLTHGASISFGSRVRVRGSKSLIRIVRTSYSSTITHKVSEPATREPRPIYFVVSREFRHSVNSTCRMATVGTARIAPGMPSSLPPTSSAVIDRDGADADLSRHHLRHEHVILDLLLHDEEDHDQQDLLQRHRGGYRDGRYRRQQRPDDRDQLADAGDQREHVEEGNAEQPQADGGRGADDGGQEQLASEPGTDLGGDGARHHVYPPAVPRREELQQELA